MKRLLCVLFILALATTAFAQDQALATSPDPSTDSDQGNSSLNPWVHIFPVQGDTRYSDSSARGSSNLTFHTGGVVVRNAKVVYIFWGPTFAQTGSADASYAAELQSFRNQFGTTPEYNTITQYYGNDPVSGYGNIAQSNLAGQGDWFDTTTPPANVSDASVQTEVKKYVTQFGVDYNAIYEVMLPATSFSSYGSQGSCGATGGVTLAYCAYHSSYADAAGKQVKYSIQPYPSCSGCRVAGFTDAQNQEHFMTHETREAVTDALGNAWYDRTGNEADDKCAWTPTPFIGTGGFAYQYEWSNANSGCIKTK